MIRVMFFERGCAWLTLECEDSLAMGFIRYAQIMGYGIEVEAL